jgi:hypothetical protein
VRHAQAAGFIMTFAGVRTGALVIALWNFLSSIPEYMIIVGMYR